MLKSQFISEPYLQLIRKPKYLTAFSRFRAGSHTLEIERGRYSNPRTPREVRLWITCKVIEDEFHFLINCKIYKDERLTLFDKVIKINSDFSSITDREKIIFLMTSDIPNILTWVAKFIHDSMLKSAQMNLK